jgi:hypothetical protein
MSAFVDTFQQVDGAYQPFIRDEQGKRHQVVAAAQPGPAYQFMCAPEKEIGLAGNKGGGKTHTLIMRMLSGVGRGWGQHYNTVLLRASLREMTDLGTLIDSIVRPIWGKAVSYNKLNHVYEWKSGEKLELNYFLDMSSLDLYYGKQFAVVAWEELSLQKSLEGYLAMFTTLRGPLPESVMPRHVLFTTNPGGASHNAIAHRFNLSGIPKGAGPCIVDAKTGETRRIIHCSWEFNRLLQRTTPNYMASIEQACEGNEPMLQAFRYGNWSITAGGALDTVFFKHSNTIFVEDFEIPATWRTFASYDHGSTRPYAWLAFAESDGTSVRLKSGRSMPTLPGDLFLIGEVYGWNGTPDKGTHESVAEITTKIQSYKIQRGWRYQDVLQPIKWHDIFKRNFSDDAIGQEMNEFSVADEFKVPVIINGIKHPGISWELVSKPPGSRETGFTLVRERLINTAPRPDSKIREGKGLFIVRDHAPNTARTLPLLTRNPKNLDDVDPASESHIFDAIKYALAADRSPHVRFSRRQVW